MVQHIACFLGFPVLVQCMCSRVGEPGNEASVACISYWLGVFWCASLDLKPLIKMSQSHTWKDKNCTCDKSRSKHTHDWYKLRYIVSVWYSDGVIHYCVCYAVDTMIISFVDRVTLIQPCLVGGYKVLQVTRDRRKVWRQVEDTQSNQQQSG